VKDYKMPGTRCGLCLGSKSTSIDSALGVSRYGCACGRRIGFIFCGRSSETLALEFKTGAEVVLEDVFPGIFLFAYDE
jgi:hypothetical protein